MRIGNLVQKKVKYGRQKSLFDKLKENKEFLILIMPAVLYFVIWHYLPMLGVVIAFKDYTYFGGILGSKWVGFDNFKFFFLSNDAWRITRNTVSYGALFIVVNAISASVVALLLFEIKNRMAIKVYQTIIILPNFLSWVVVGFVTYILFNPTLGVVNQLLSFVGIKEVDLYMEPKYWLFILTVTNTWKGLGMNTIIYYAALLGTNQELFEAADLDGANGLQKCWHISVPSLIPLMTILSILAVGNILRGDFGLFYQISRDVGALYPTTDVIDTYIYRGIRTGDMSVATAVGFFQSFVGFALVIATNKIVKKIEPSNSLF